MKNKYLIRFCLLLFAVIFAVTGCGQTSTEVRNSHEYCKISNTIEKVQYSDGYYYFYGDKLSVYKYSFETGKISDVCTDPQCVHFGDATCRLGQVMPSFFFKVKGNNVLYSVYLAKDLSSTSGTAYPCLYCYNTESLTNKRLDIKEYGEDNKYVASETSLYYINTEYDSESEKYYFNIRRCNYITGEISDITEKLEDSTFRLVGAESGQLFYYETNSGITYIYDESDSKISNEFWGTPVSYMWSSGDEFYFRARDPEEEKTEDSKYYIYHTDYKGNIINKYDVGDVKCMCVSRDGKKLYYILREENAAFYYDNSPVTTSSGATHTVSGREIYEIDTESGEKSVFFTMSGDFSALDIANNLGASFFVEGNNIIVNNISGYLKNRQSGEQETFAYNTGMTVIEANTGKITHISANYEKGEHISSTNIESITLEY